MRRSEQITIAMCARLLSAVLAAGSLSVPVLAGFSGPGGPRLNYDRPPTIAPYDKSVISPNSADEPSNRVLRKSPPPRIAPPPANDRGAKRAVPKPGPTHQARPKRSAPKKNAAGARAGRTQARPRRVPSAQPPGGMRRQTPPQNADQRRRLLTELYGYLSKAKSQEQAARLSTSIERLWMHSESATTSLLMKRTDRAIETGRWRIAERFADAVVKLDGDYSEGLMRRAYIRYQLNQPTRALRDLQRVLTLEPNHFIALDRSGAIQSSLGEHKAALKSYRKLKRINPNAPNVDERINALIRKIDGEAI